MFFPVCAGIWNICWMPNLNSVHSREGCYVYIKEVERGETDVLLGSEEKDALEQALGYH